MWELVSLATPLVSGLFCTMGVEVISLAYMGYLADVHILAGTGLGTMMLNAVCMSFLFGSIRGMETFVSQAQGKGDSSLTIAYMNRGRAVLSFCSCLWP